MFMELHSLPEQENRRSALQIQVILKIWFKASHVKFELLNYPLSIKAFEDARPVVRWLNKQRKVGGGYGSTQVTQTPSKLHLYLFLMQFLIIFVHSA